MQVKKQAIAIFGNYKWLFHVLFLILVHFLFMGKLNYKEVTLIKHPKTIANFLLLRVIIRWCCVIGLIYGYFFVVIPIAKIFKTGFSFILLLITNCTLYIFLHHIFVSLLTNHYPLSKVLAVPNWYNIQGTIFQSILFIFCSFLSMWYFIEIFLHQKKINNYASQLQMQVTAEKVFLQQQINPHFLFNTLNNIYASSMHDKPKALMLTKGLKYLLQYMTKDATTDFVPLQAEIAFIQNYLYLEKARNTDANLLINFDIKGNTNDIKIAPLLLINFIENAFKHGVKASINKASVNICITVLETTIYFECINSVPTINPQSQTNLESSKGIGIANTKKRLQLIYPSTHTLQIIESNHIYAVHLTIPI